MDKTRETRPEFMDRLKKVMPKKPEPVQDWSKGIAEFKPQPIRQAADSFSRFLDNDLPVNDEEMRAALWVFGEMAFGHMEKMVAAYSKIANDFIACNIKPTIFEPGDKTFWDSETAYFEERVSGKKQG